MLGWSQPMASPSQTADKWQHGRRDGNVLPQYSRAPGKDQLKHQWRKRGKGAQLDGVYLSLDQEYGNTPVKFHLLSDLEVRSGIAKQPVRGMCLPGSMLFPVSANPCVGSFAPSDLKILG